MNWRRYARLALGLTLLVGLAPVGHAQRGSARDLPTPETPGLLIVAFRSPPSNAKSDVRAAIAAEVQRRTSRRTLNVISERSMLSILQGGGENPTEPADFREMAKVLYGDWIVDLVITDTDQGVLVESQLLGVRPAFAARRLPTVTMPRRADVIRRMADVILAQPEIFTTRRSSPKPPSR